MNVNTLKYLNVKNQILTNIKKGIWKPGEKIPAITQLVERFGASQITIGHALRLLVDEGVIIRKRGAGTFICQTDVTAQENNQNYGTINIVLNRPSQKADSSVNWMTNSEIHRGIINNCRVPVKMIKENEIKTISANHKQQNHFIFFNWSEDQVKKVLNKKSIYCRINSVPKLFSPFWSINYDAQVSFFNAVVYALSKGFDTVLSALSTNRKEELLPGFIEAHKTKNRSFSKKQNFTYSDLTDIDFDLVKKWYSYKKSKAIITDCSMAAVKIKKLLASVDSKESPLQIAYDDDPSLNEEHGITGIAVPYFEIGKKAVEQIKQNCIKRSPDSFYCSVFGKVIPR